MSSAHAYQWASSMPGLRLDHTKAVVKYRCASEGKIVNITINTMTDSQRKGEAHLGAA